jgi:hypothetical protein
MDTVAQRREDSLMRTNMRADVPWLHHQPEQTGARQVQSRKQQNDVHGPEPSGHTLGEQAATEDRRAYLPR